MRLIGKTMNYKGQAVQLELMVLLAAIYLRDLYLGAEDPEVTEE